MVTIQQQRHRHDDNGNYEQISGNDDVQCHWNANVFTYHIINIIRKNF